MLFVSLKNTLLKQIYFYITQKKIVKFCPFKINFQYTFILHS